jgi:hypothetical protein
MNNPLPCRAKHGRVIVVGKSRQDLGRQRSIPFNTLASYILSRIWKINTYTVLPGMMEQHEAITKRLFQKWKQISREKQFEYFRQRFHAAKARAIRGARASGASIILQTGKRG